MEPHAQHPENFEVKAVRSIWSRPWVRLIVIFLAGFLSGFIVFSLSEGAGKDKDLH